MLTVREQTNRRVLPQPAALESVPADTPGVGTKRGTDARISRASGSQRGRGETDFRVRVAPSGAGRKATQQNPVVFVLDRRKKPLMPTSERRARRLLKDGRAVVHRAVPFTIRVKDRTVEDSVVPGVEVGVDPGSQATGLAVFTTTEIVDTVTGEVTTARRGIWLGELVHRGLRIKLALLSRAGWRRGRRSRRLRYRAPRYANRARRPAPGYTSWLAPSLRHRVDGTLAWLSRLRAWLPVTGIHIENVRFDTHALHRPEVSGVEYQRGALFGYEVREYLLEKWGRACIYCDATGVLNLDHLTAKSKGGSDRVSNLAPACPACNQRKGNTDIRVFLADDPARLARILTTAKTPLRDAAAVNTTRRELTSQAQGLGVPVHTATGGRTKWNRTRNDVPKTHALDALNVGELDTVTGWPDTTMTISCTGRGRYQRTTPDKHGFPRLTRPRHKQHHGFATGDLVRAAVPAGVKAGTHTGKVAVRATGSFKIGKVDGIHYRHITLIQRGDGYTYHTGPTT